ncbi:chromate efflux transporter [Aerolutibacter ruishenii]|uniref:Chromate transporter n=1 Tax=Aerolutibacter ruishenii TaxID=686800 RepID=A0A562LVI3_9GAMM|nr:chromate efflux transporter [Lysobacter ruishenii]TWI11528.1 chromate transporter [Lysobacter ruishenii]
MHPHDNDGTSRAATPGTTRPPSGTAAEVFRVFLVLGLTSFGGPIAHLGYLRTAFVERRRWLDESQFAQLLAVCQFLPGPASSQMGFAIGLFRAGWRGALAAFAGFTLPSALLMLVFALLTPRWQGEIGAATVHGLKLVAVAVVAHGLLGMIRQLAPDGQRLLIAGAAAAVVALTGNAWVQLAVIVMGAVLGPWLCRQAKALPTAVFPVHYGARGAAFLFSLFLLGLGLALAWQPSPTPSVAGIAAAFYQAGALVFGGGHVVLPLLQQTMVDSGWMTADTFLAGYGAAQAVPGPMFSLAAYLGATVPMSHSPAVGGLVALLSIFAPGFLLLGAVLPVWTRLASHRAAASVVAGINAAVVGLLAAAFHDPVWTQGVRNPTDLAIALVGFAMLAWLRASALWVVLWCVAASLAATLVA